MLQATHSPVMVRRLDMLDRATITCPSLPMSQRHLFPVDRNSTDQVHLAASHNSKGVSRETPGTNNQSMRIQGMPILARLRPCPPFLVVTESLFRCRNKQGQHDCARDLS
jgi:hypothetical protein